MFNKFRHRLKQAFETRDVEYQRQCALDDISRACAEAVLREDWPVARFHADMYRRLKFEKGVANGFPKLE